MIQDKALLSSTALIAAVLVSGCGANSETAMPEDAVQVTRVDAIASQARGMQSIAFSGGSAYVSLYSSANEGTAVLKTALPLQANSTWTPTTLGSCALGKSNEYVMPRAPSLKVLGETLWMFQPWSDGPGAGQPEHSLCSLNTQAGTFTPRDQGLRTCNDYFCSTLWMSDLKQSGNRLYSNAGAGLNLFVSQNQGANWRVMMGAFDSMMCTHQSFHIVGERLLVGGECPLDFAFLRAYPLSADGASLASQEELPITVPQLQNRNIQFIESVPGTQRVFVGVEGGLLRSDDGGRTFKFVIEYPLEGGKKYPYVQAFLAPASKKDVIVVGGFDKANSRPYMAWSADAGTTWTDISEMLPGYTRAANDTGTAMVLALAEDPQGRLLFTLNENEGEKGRLMHLTLGKQ
jgi:hypothetical protein